MVTCHGPKARRVSGGTLACDLLIVEDEPKTAAYLKKGLEEHGFVVDVAGKGDNGLHLAERRLRPRHPRRDAPRPRWVDDHRGHAQEGRKLRLFLTARDAVEDRVKGLELGADDYLVKPFAFSELLARVRSFLRQPDPSARTSAWPSSKLTWFATGPSGRAAARPDSKEFALLSLLARRAGEVLSRTSLPSRLGRELRQRYERRGRPRATAPVEGGRPVCEETDPYRPRGGVCPRRASLIGPSSWPGRMAQTWSLAARLTAWYAGSAFVLVVAATGFLYWASIRNIDHEDDQVLGR